MVAASSHTDSWVFEASSRAMACKLRGYLAYNVVDACQCDAAAFHEADLSTVWRDAKISKCVGRDRDCSLEEVAREWQGDETPLRIVPVVLAPQHALRVVQLQCQIVHAIPLSLRTPRKLFLPDAPNALSIKRFTTMQLPVDRPSKRSKTNGGTVARDPAETGAYSADLVIDWLRATRHIRQTTDAHVASEDYARAHARGTTMTHTELLGGVEEVGRETIRKARVRFDVLLMLIWRIWWAATAPGETWFHLYCDASPQLRGLELFASTFDVYYAMEAGMQFKRRLFPNVMPLGKNVLGKVFTMLWQIFLMFGPDVERIAAFLGRVVSITTDMGTEHLIADAGNCLQEFFRIFGDSSAGAVLAGANLFPNALLIGGWRHLWDNIICRSLCSLFFFPRWVLELKVSSPITLKIKFVTTFSQNFNMFGSTVSQFFYKKRAAPKRFRPNMASTSGLKLPAEFGSQSSDDPVLGTTASVWEPCVSSSRNAARGAAVASCFNNQAPRTITCGPLDCGRRDGAAVAKMCAATSLLCSLLSLRSLCSMCSLCSLVQPVQYVQPVQSVPPVQRAAAI